MLNKNWLQRFFLIAYAFLNCHRRLHHYSFLQLYFNDIFNDFFRELSFNTFFSHNVTSFVVVAIVIGEKEQVQVSITKLETKVFFCIHWDNYSFFCVNCLNVTSKEERDSNLELLFENKLFAVFLVLPRLEVFDNFKWFVLWT